VPGDVVLQTLGAREVEDEPLAACGGKLPLLPVLGVLVAGLLSTAVCQGVISLFILMPNSEKAQTLGQWAQVFFVLVHMLVLVVLAGVRALNWQRARMVRKKMKETAKRGRAYLLYDSDDADDRGV
jgi:uncharacterized protein YhhL (DUF1145 family)